MPPPNTIWLYRAMEPWSCWSLFWELCCPVFMDSVWCAPSTLTIEFMANLVLPIWMDCWEVRLGFYDCLWPATTTASLIVTACIGLTDRWMGYSGEQGLVISPPFDDEQLSISHSLAVIKCAKVSAGHGLLVFPSRLESWDYLFLCCWDARGRDRAFGVTLIIAILVTPKSSFTDRILKSDALSIVFWVDESAKSTIYNWIELSLTLEYNMELLASFLPPRFWPLLLAVTVASL